MNGLLDVHHGRPLGNGMSSLAIRLRLGDVLAGVALAGAGMAVASRRTHSHAAHPA